jgi:Lon protease-like protein
MEKVLKPYNFEKLANELPKKIPIFPLNSVLLLPRCKLPLNLFENRYLYMFDYALQKDRYIGMIQPSETVKSNLELKNPQIYPVGCAGKIVAFNQTNDNRYEIVLHGVCRFKILNEETNDNGFRIANICWKNYLNDLKLDNSSTIEKRTELEDKLKAYFKKININADWQAIEASSDEDLVNSISMGCSFTTAENRLY